MLYVGASLDGGVIRCMDAIWMVIILCTSFGSR